MPANSWKLAPGLNNVGSFQVSGKPFLSGACLAPASGSSLVVRFPTVTKWLQLEPIQAMPGGASLRVAFSENGLHGKGGSYVNIHPSSSFCRPIDMKVSEVWVMSEAAGSTVTFDIMAGLTNVQNSSLYTADRTINGVVEASGPNWSGSIGVG
tara:strand:+ start:1867 stop:2325 length:459 start_codon:yes stop_codon:yes gene_type:complete